MSKKSKNRSAADIAHVQAVQDLRRGSASQPIRNKRIYRRADHRADSGRVFDRTAW